MGVTEHNTEWSNTMIKQKKWYNFGNVNHREHGGNFVRIDGDWIEVVHTTNNEESGWNDGIGYTFKSRTESVEELTRRFKLFSQGGLDACGNYADWTIFMDKDRNSKTWDMDEIVMRMASDILGYYGGDLEPDMVTNYWYGHNALGSYGIKPYMFRRKLCLP